MKPDAYLIVKGLPSFLHYSNGMLHFQTRLAGDGRTWLFCAAKGMGSRLKDQERAEKLLLARGVDFDVLQALKLELGFMPPDERGVRVMDRLVREGYAIGISAEERTRRARAWKKLGCGRPRG